MYAEDTTRNDGDDENCDFACMEKALKKSMFAPRPAVNACKTSDCEDDGALDAAVLVGRE